ncbi:endolytic transglycosylase MltG [Desulfosporosinus youngiae]|jgi:UPF0755 protein|uniref:Endolytic murein transglycosylase n=1 Tax=Desulfosporosinus youngiae DSM 17734 TaxID=768710 RepID=H5XSF1_9FIRM|nr:endolytic transglycosylase MltG [Desulfosporosinus youngiae]EHQ88051.1 hypothetical protein, YceG family [Desulfosporosinus youngiae DSM 17734]
MARKKKKMGLVRWIVLLCFVGGFGFLAWWSWAIKPYSTSGNSVKITISPGATAGQLAEELQERQLIRSALMFRFLARERQEDFKLYVGDYQLAPTMPPSEIINRLISRSDSPDTDRITIPEGYTTQQIIELLVQKGIGTKEEYTKLVTEGEFPYPFLKDAPKGIHRLEGYLFPNTYNIYVNTTPYEAIDLLLRQFAKELTPDVQTQLDTMKLTVAQWVTLGSLIEKEAMKAEDRPLIASVLMNRLKINQPLQIDATIQFLLETPKPKLTYEDLQIPSPYNTYLHRGFPPGPIANPGHASLQAVLNPAQTNYRYYVAKDDGYHAFAETYAEHLKNVELYQ